MRVICDYCLRPARLVKGHVIHSNRPDLWNRYFWRCSACDAYVGAHKKTKKPLGKLANKKLRMLRIQAHKFFDTLWRKRELGRTRAYSILANELEIKLCDCHIGMFDVKTCLKVIAICKEGLGYGRKE